jgi:hypothetical protein
MLLHYLLVTTSIDFVINVNNPFLLITKKIFINYYKYYISHFINHYINHYINYYINHYLIQLHYKQAIYELLLICYI